jgi:hypothetical protein
VLARVSKAVEAANKDHKHGDQIKEVIMSMQVITYITTVGRWDP